LLGENLAVEHDYTAVVEGVVPENLRGTLYRNGPGLFERDGYKKKHLLDGDGMIQAVDFSGGDVRYRNHFVQTPKFIAEEEAGKFLMPTWTTLAPDFWNSIPGTPSESQAGVTTYMVNGRLTAHDEAGQPFELDPVTLEDLGEMPVMGEEGPGSYKAHTKVDGRTGDWIFVGWNHGPTPGMEVVIKNRDGGLALHRKVEADRDCYIHDFFASENYVVVNMHAMAFNPFPMLAGMRSFTDSLSWEPELGNLLVVIPKDASREVQYFEAPGRFMWHSFNMFERGTELVADFIAYDDPDHFIGEDPLFKAVMQGRMSQAQYSGVARRYVMNLQSGRLGEEQLAEGNYEFPVVHPALAGYEYSVGYASFGSPGTILHSGLARIDMKVGLVDGFDFGSTTHIGEPIFVPEGVSEDRGYLLAMGLDGESRKSFIAVMDAGNLSAGPLARVNLRHHTPLSFHGCWAAQA
jgi:all-trans-8'-apo-beta-carotenal 15,15'-oxygenase